MSKKTSVRDRAMLAVTPATESPATARSEQPRTAPGAFLGFMQKESEVARENELLRKELQSWDGASAVRPLDPSLVDPGPYANRLEDSFQSDAFAAFKKEIESAGRNVQAIKVRPLPGTVPQRYEIVYGHRRHRACLELGFPVWAAIESMDDATSFTEMERENRQRANLSPYEQGRMYVRGLALFQSMRKLSEHIHRDVSDISKAVALASLPAEIVAAFPSPNDLQFRWAKPLADSHARNPAALKELAASVSQRRASGESMTPLAVFALLTGLKEASRSGARQLLLGGQVIGTVSDVAGKVTLTLYKGAVPADKLLGLEAAVLAALQ